jgi:hypothetical protein
MPAGERLTVSFARQRCWSRRSGQVASKPFRSGSQFALFFSPAERRARGVLLGLAWLLAVVVANNWAIESWSDQDYLHWHLENGALISLGFAFFSAAINLDAVEDLISAHPVRFVAAYIGVVSTLGLFFLGAVGGNVLFPEKRVSVQHDRRPSVRTIADGVVTCVLAFAAEGVALAWLVLIVPAQYFRLPSRRGPGPPPSRVADKDARHDRPGRHAPMVDSP